MLNNNCLLCHAAKCTKACGVFEPDRYLRSLYFDNEYVAMNEIPDELPCLNCDARCEKACVNHVSIKDILTKIRTDRTDKKTITYDCLRTDFCGFTMENPFLLSSSVVASTYDMCARAFDAGWAGVAFKTVCLMDIQEASPRFSALQGDNNRIIGFKNIEQLSDHTLIENIKIFKELKKNHPELEFVPLLKDERFYSHPDLKEGIRLLPNRFEGEGQFIALLKKPGEVKIHHEKAGKPLKQFLKELEAYGLEERDNLILHDGIESLPHPFDIRPLNVLRYGVRAFDFKEKLVLPAHHLTHYLDAKESIPLNEEELAKYIGGETLNLKAKDGWDVVSFQGANLGWFKAKNNVAKNHYPKGLRRKLK
jgi:NOL1/NOP2/fmu family ribosome biogenesis protein